MGNIVKVGMADLNICKAPDGITTLGLGSCVGVALREPGKPWGGLAHVMLPDSTRKNIGTSYEWIHWIGSSIALGLNPVLTLHLL